MLEGLRETVWRLHLELSKNNLVTWTSGNISARDPETGNVVIKPSGVRYEDLCREADEILRSIFRLVNLDPASAGSDFLSVSHHILGNAMRLKSTGEIRLDEKWRTSLASEQLAVFDRLGGPLNRRFGYR